MPCDIQKHPATPIIQRLSDRNTTIPIHPVHEKLITGETIVRQGFRERPIRDGGGKPSYGRLPPAMRPRNPLATVGTAFLTATTAAGLNHEVHMAILLNSEIQPIKETTVSDLRHFLAK